LPVFFSDRDLGKQFPRILHDAGISVKAHHEHFAHDTEDDVWIREVATQGWIALTHNERIRYTPNEIKAVFDSGLAMIILVGHTTTTDLATNFVNTLPKIEEFLQQQAPPFIAKVYRPSPGRSGRQGPASGRIELWTDSPPP
jgi:hypothetical protein